jgi:hypothetical protein
MRQPVCKECNTREKAAKIDQNQTCPKCENLIVEGDELLRFRSELFHANHFSCKSCNQELKSTAREVKGDLYCVKCYEKLDLPVCAACRTTIDQERVVYALGKPWHVEVRSFANELNCQFFKIKSVQISKNINLFLFSFLFEAFRLRQMREAVQRIETFREARPGLLRDALQSAVWKAVFRLQCDHQWRYIFFNE